MAIEESTLSLEFVRQHRVIVIKERDVDTTRMLYAKVPRCAHAMTSPEFMLQQPKARCIAIDKPQCDFTRRVAGSIIDHHDFPVGHRLRADTVKRFFKKSLAVPHNDHHRDTRRFEQRGKPCRLDITHARRSKPVRE